MDERTYRHNYRDKYLPHQGMVGALCIRRLLMAKLLFAQKHGREEPGFNRAKSFCGGKVSLPFGNFLR